MLSKAQLPPSQCAARYGAVREVLFTEKRKYTQRIFTTAVACVVCVIGEQQTQKRKPIESIVFLRLL